MDSLDYLFGLDQFGIKLGLENIRTIAEALGDPQDRYQSILVAGTNGKGSVTAMIEAALRTAGHRSARYTSPHLMALEERYVINGAPIDRRALREVVADVRDVVARLRLDGRLATQPTFFEVATAAAFELFRRAAVDIAVLEVGMGGRFDATNIASPLVAAITTIDFDHERYLGTSIAEIAREKAGIIRPGIPVVTGETKGDALDVIARHSTEVGARLVHARDGVRVEATMRRGRIVLDLETSRGRYGTFPLALRGRHQVQNALVAVRVLEELDRLGVAVPLQAVREGLAQVAWPGRLDLFALRDGRQVLLDAAHNPAGAAALAEYLREAYPAGVPIVLGAMRDKNVEDMVAALVPAATRFVCTQAAIGRALPVDELVPRLRRRARVPVEGALPSWHAVTQAFNGSTVCVTGSIFLIGEIMATLDEQRAGRVD